MFFVKTIISALIIAGVSEVSKRSNFWAAFLISLPITSILSFVWIYVESKDTKKIAALSYDVLYLVIPSLLFFVVLPVCIKFGLNFWPALVLSIIATPAAYAVAGKFI